MMDTYEFNYETFDRQMHNLLLMSQVFIDGRDDCGTTELTFDIRSLCAKASRLCFMSDYDIALQREDILHSRRTKNAEFLSRLDKLVKEQLPTFMIRATNDFREGKGVKGRKSPEFPSALSSLLPRLVTILKDDAENSDKWNALILNIEDTEAIFEKKVTLTPIPGVKDVERYWMLIHYYALMCYLLMHFQRTIECTNVELTPEEIERMFTSSVLGYAQSEVGSAELERYQAVLLFNNNQQPLSVDMLQSARKALLTEVPTRFQLCFVKNIDNIGAFANAFYALSPSAEEFLSMLSSIAKYQLLTEEIYKLQHPESIHKLYNEVFNTTINGRPVDLNDLRNRIKRMLSFVTKKNHWFCVWAVLRHNNLIAKDASFESFARQMMHKDWFKDVDSYQQFKGDNLRDYSGYLSSTDYTRWNIKEFHSWHRLYNKKKLSLDLSDKFQRICMDMEEAFGEEG